MRTKTYIDGLKEKADKTFSDFKKEADDYISKISHHSDGTVSTSIDSHSLAFNWFLADTNECVKGCSGILHDALINLSVLVENSVFLAAHGSHTAACSELRNALDSFLTRIFFLIIDEKGLMPKYWKNRDEQLVRFDTERKGPLPMPKGAKRYASAYSDWMLGKSYVATEQLVPPKIVYKDFPSSDEIDSIIFAQKNVSEYNKKYMLRKHIRHLYRELSKYVHGRPSTSYKKSYSYKSSLLNYRFVMEDFKKYFDFLKELHLRTITLLMLLFPGYLAPNKHGVHFTGAHQFKSYFPDEFAQIVEIVGRKNS